MHRVGAFHSPVPYLVPALPFAPDDCRACRLGSHNLAWTCLPARTVPASRLPGFCCFYCAAPCVWDAPCWFQDSFVRGTPAAAPLTCAVSAGRYLVVPASAAGSFCTCLPVSPLPYVTTWIFCFLPCTLPYPALLPRCAHLRLNTVDRRDALAKHGLRARGSYYHG